MKISLLGLAAAGLLAAPAQAQMKIEPMGELSPDQQRFFELYEELVETDTTPSNGNCTQAAEQLAARLKAAGMAEENVMVLTVPAHPKDGSLMAIYPGASNALEPMLLLGHIDVVEAKRADWAPAVRYDRGERLLLRARSDRR